MSSLDLVFVYKQRECLRLSIPSFLSMSLSEMVSAAKWVNQRMREKMEVQILYYTDYEGDVIATDHPSAEAFLVLMCDCKHSQQMAVIFECSIEPRNLTWERRNYRAQEAEKPIAAAPALANEEHFLKTLQKLEKQQEVIKETAQRTLAQQRCILRSYEMKDMTGRRRNPSPPYVAPVPESSMTMDTFHKMMLEDVRKESPKRNPSAREVDLIDFMNQLETEFLQAELNCNLQKIDRSVSSAVALEKPAESMSTTTLSISEPVTHSVCERAHIARETQTEKKEEKSQETSTYESEPQPDKLTSEVERLFIDGKLRQKLRHGHKDKSSKSGNKREKSPKSAITKKPKKDVAKMKVSRNRPLTGILKEYPLKKVGNLYNKEIFTKDFKMVNVSKGVLENVQIKLIRSSPDVVEMVSGEPPIIIENGKSVKVTVGVACDARRVQLSFASFALHTSSGAICSPIMHIYLIANTMLHQLPGSPRMSNFDRFLAPVEPICATKVTGANTSSAETPKTIEVSTDVSAEASNSKSKAAIAPPIMKSNEVILSTNEAGDIPLGQEVFEQVVGDNDIHQLLADLIRRLNAGSNKSSEAAPPSEVRIEGEVFESFVGDNVELVHKVTPVQSVKMNVKSSAVKSDVIDFNEDKSEIENAKDAWSHYNDVKEYASGSDYEFSFDEGGSDFEIIPSTSSTVNHEN